MDYIDTDIKIQARSTFTDSFTGGNSNSSFKDSEVGGSGVKGTIVQEAPIEVIHEDVLESRYETSRSLCKIMLNPGVNAINIITYWVA